jgi:uncharacterized protein (TIGR02145 family)
VTATNANGTSSASSASNYVTPPVTDGDGNVYNTVTIGTQIWMKGNLKTMKFNYGTSIPNVTDNTTWAGLTSAAYCWYNNDAATYKTTYGALYNWYAVDVASNDGKNVCPAGWHIPSDAEWTTLTDYLGGASVAGSKLKETGTTHWLSPNTGATNESGFTALPGGGHSRNGNIIYHWQQWLLVVSYIGQCYLCMVPCLVLTITSLWIKVATNSKVGILFVASGTINQVKRCSDCSLYVA